MTSNKNYLRERQIRRLLEESILFMLSEDADMPDPGSAVPPVTTTPDASTNQPTPEQPAPEQPQAEKEFDVDSMVEKLNVLRGGRSLKDPEIYGDLTGFFNKLSPEQKQMLDWFLTEIGKVVISASEANADLPTHSTAVNNTNAQPVPPAQTAPAPQSNPAPVAPAQ